MRAPRRRSSRVRPGMGRRAYRDSRLPRERRPKLDYDMVTMAGYSGTPLVTKLGIKVAHKIAFVAAPDDFERTLGALPPGVSATRGGGRGPFDVIVCFVT